MSKEPGAPTKYKDEYPKELIEYFSIDPYEEKTVEVNSIKHGVQTIHQEVANNFPSFAGFATKINVTPQTMLNWCKDYPEWKEAYEMAKAHQENFLLVNGLKGLTEKTMTIFTMKNACGYRDKHPEEKDDININISLADKIAKARARVNKGTNSEDS